jgi:hypothetical protein
MSTLSSRLTKLEATAPAVTPHEGNSVPNGFVFVAYESGMKQCACGNWLTPDNPCGGCSLCGHEENTQ